MRGSSSLFLMAWHIALVIGARSGPFKASFTRVEKCSKPTQPLDKDPAAAFFVELYNTTTETNLMRGKISVYRELRVKKMVAKSYLWVKNKWKVNYVMDNFLCNRILFPLIAMSVGIEYNKETCSFYKGDYVFSNYNVNSFQHTWMKTQEYGKVLWKFEVFSHTGNMFCYEMETLIVPDG